MLDRTRTYYNQLDPNARYGLKVVSGVIVSIIAGFIAGFLLSTIV